MPAAPPPMNSLPPRLWPWIGLAGVEGRALGDCGGEAPVDVCEVPAGLNENAGKAFTDFCRWCGMEPRRPVGYAWRDMGRGLLEESEEAAGPRIGKEKSGLGSSSTGPALEPCLRW